MPRVRQAAFRHRWNADARHTPAAERPVSRHVSDPGIVQGDQFGQAGRTPGRAAAHRMAPGPSHPHHAGGGDKLPLSGIVEANET